MSSGVFIDWDDDGFGTGAYDDVSADIMGWIIRRGSSPEITGQATTGEATITLKHTSGRYNPDNGSSPLTGLLRDGPKVYVSVNADGTVGSGTSHPLFGGRIAEISPIPKPAADPAPSVEIVAEDALSWFSRIKAQVADSITRSQKQLRQAILDEIGETRYELAEEPTPLPLSSASGDALSSLSALNAANGTRHFVAPGATADDWYVYKTVARMEKLNGVADDTISGASDHMNDISNWRKTAATVINEQAATVEPISFPTGKAVVWQLEQGLPIKVLTGTPVTLWADFGDFVVDPETLETHTGSGLTVTMTPFGHTAKIVLTSAGATSVKSLAVLGRLVVRGPAITVVEEDLTSSAPPRGVRSGPDIQGDFVGTIASARGMAQHIVWRYATPLLRPSITVANWLPNQFDLDLYDILSITIPSLDISAKLFEIVGLEHKGIMAAEAGKVYHESTFQLQESRVQSPKAWFTWDVDKWTTGPGVLGY